MGPLRILSIVVAITFLPCCKPDKPEADKHRVVDRGQRTEEAEDETRRGILAVEVGEYVITVGELEDALWALPPHRRYYYSNPERMRTFAMNYAVMQILAREAEKRGLADSAYVRYAFERALVSKYKRVFSAQAVRMSDITDEDVDRYLVLSQGAEPESTSETTSSEPRMTRAAARATLLEERQEQAWQAHVEDLCEQLGIGAPQSALVF